jgi:lipid II:glycine glycyltransferase (peptidoglycan interpeptide bridge formation enzyme)
MLEKILLLQKDWKFIEIRPLQLAPDLKSGFALSQRFHLHKLDLGPKIEHLFDKFDKRNVQRRIRRAERAELSYTTGRSEDQLIQFYSLMVLTRRRHRLPPPPIEWYRTLLTFMKRELSIRRSRLQ